MKDTTWPAAPASCLGKASFSSPQIANKALRRRGIASDHRRDAVRGRAKQAVYRCTHCGLFHIGTQTKSVHARRRRDQEGDREDMD